MKKIILLILILFTFSISFASDINLDGFVTVNCNLNMNPKANESESIGLMYLGIKGDAYFIGLIREPVNSSSFVLDQAYGIFDLGFANLFLGKKVQNFRVSSFGEDLWLAGNLSIEIPNKLGNLYLAFDSNFDSKSTNEEDKLPKVNVLFADFLFNTISLKTVLYNNYKMMETGINVNLSMLNVLSFLKYNLEELKLEEMTGGLNLKFDSLNLTTYFTPTVEDYSIFDLGVDGEYKIKDELLLKGSFSYNSEKTYSKFGVSADYNYKDLVVTPSVEWDGSKEEDKTSGSLSVTMHF